MEAPRAHWSKELDLRLVQAIQTELGAGHDEVRHQRGNAGTNLDWASVLRRLHTSPEGWPAAVTSILELRKRWDNSLRIWYARHQIKTQEGAEKVTRASVLSLKTLVEILEQRDYIEDSKPGPRRGSKMQKRQFHRLSAGDSSQHDASLATENGEDEEEPDSPQKRSRPASLSLSLSDSTPLTSPTRSAPRSEPAPAPPAPSVGSAPSAPAVASPAPAFVAASPAARPSSASLLMASPPAASPPTPPVAPLPVPDSQLEPWLVLLRAAHEGEVPLLQDFRFHTRSGVVLEPRVLYDAFVSEGPATADLFPHLVALARALAPPEWRTRVCDAADHHAFQALAAARRSFVLVPSSRVAFEKRVLLFVAVLFPPAEADRAPALWSFLRGRETDRDGPSDSVSASHAAEVEKTLGLPASLVRGAAHWHRHIVAPSNPLSTLSAPLVALSLFSLAAAKLPATPDTGAAVSLQPLARTWLGVAATRQRLLAEMLVTQDACIRRAPPAEPLALPFSALSVAIEALGVPLPPWCHDFPPEKRHSLLSAVRDISRATVMLVPLGAASASRHELTWQPQPHDKELLLLAERGGAYGGIVRLHNFTERQATVSVLGSAASFKRLACNGVERRESAFVGERAADGTLVLEIAVEQSTRIRLAVVKAMVAAHGQ